MIPVYNRNTLRQIQNVLTLYRQKKITQMRAAQIIHHRQNKLIRKATAAGFKAAVNGSCTLDEAEFSLSLEIINNEGEKNGN